MSVRTRYKSFLPHEFRGQYIVINSLRTLTGYLNYSARNCLNKIITLQKVHLNE